VEKDVTFAEWIDQMGKWENPHLQDICRGLTQAIVGREPEDIGAHYFLDYINSGQGLTESLMSETRDGAQYQWLKNGQSFSSIGRRRTLTPIS
jgi:monoamine oxidase